MTSPIYGITPAGFALKPLSVITSDLNKAWLANVDPDANLAPTTPEGQIVAMVAAEAFSEWQMMEAAWNSYNRDQVEGAGLDNLGDLEGNPREGPSYTQCFCDLTLVAGTYPAGTLIANVLGNPALTFANLNDVTSAGGSTPGILMQCTTIGQTPSVNPATLTQITTPVTGWTGITNPTEQSQLGSAEELDAAYAVRQQEEVAKLGSCTLPATVDAILRYAETSLGIMPSVQVLENRTDFPVAIGTLTLPGHSFAAIVYDSTGTLTPHDIAQEIWDNKPAGISIYGTSAPVIINDPDVGPQMVRYVVPTTIPLFVSVTVALLDGFDFGEVEAAIQSALVAAAVAPTIPGNPAPIGQLLPGGTVVRSQLSAVIQGVPGVFDVQVLTFGPNASPTNTSAITADPTQVLTILAATVATNVLVTQGNLP